MAQSNLKFRNKGQDRLDPGFMAKLESLGIPLDVTSGYRSPEHNKKVGAGKGSQHVHGKAADISLAGMNEAQRQDVIRKLAKAGTTRFITYTNMPDILHVDEGKPVSGNYWFMHDKSNKNMGRAPGWFRSVQKELLTGTPQGQEPVGQSQASMVPSGRPALSGIGSGAGTGSPIMAMFEEKSMAKDDKKKPALAKKPPERGAPWIDKAGLKVGPWTGPTLPGSIPSWTLPAAMDPFGGDYTPGPQHSTGGNMILGLPSLFGDDAANQMLGPRIGQSVRDFWFTPEGELNQKPLNIGGPRIDLDKAFGETAESAPGTPGSGNFQIKTGVPGTTVPDPFLMSPMQYPDAPTVPPPPDAPMPIAPDYGPYRAAMAGLAPESMSEDQFKQDRRWGAVARALAAGAGGSGHSGWGGALARAGAGMGEAGAQLGDDWLERQLSQHDASREWAMSQADLERQLMESSTNIANQGAQTQYGNQTRRYETDRSNAANQYEVTTKNLQELHTTAQVNAKAIFDTELARSQLGQPSVENMTKDGLVIKRFDEQGNIVFDVQRWGEGSEETGKLLNVLKKREDYLGGDSPQVQIEKYSLLFESGNTEAVKYQITEDAVEGGYIETLVPDIDALNEQVDETLLAQGANPGDEQYEEQRNQMLATLASQQIDLTSQEQMMQAAQMGNMGARYLLQVGQ